MTNDTIQLELSIEEINLILESLGELPFRRVFHLIGHIQAAARAQIHPDGEVAASGNCRRAREIEEQAIGDEAPDNCALRELRSAVSTIPAAEVVPG